MPSDFLRGASQCDQRRPTTTFFYLVAFSMPLVGFGMGLVALVLHFQPKTFPRRLRRGRLWSPSPMWNKTERFRSRTERLLVPQNSQLCAATQPPVVPTGAAARLSALQNDKNDFFEHSKPLIKSHEKSSERMKTNL